MFCDLAFYFSIILSSFFEVKLGTKCTWRENNKYKWRYLSEFGKSDFLSAEWQKKKEQSQNCK